jgi:Domain of unknown function (DUF4349)
MRKLLAVLAIATALSACGQAKQYASEEPVGGVPAAAPMEQAQTEGGEVAVDVPQAPAAANAAAPPAATAAPAPTLYLAYSYNVGLEVPAQGLAEMVARHVQACQSAGPRLCQLIGSNVSGDPESSMNGFVSLRGEPAWLRTLRRGLAAEADAAGGRVVQETTNTEDLTRAIVDTEARLRAQTALRDRLQRLLESRPGRLADLLEVERELARVQGEIDSVQSNLAVMRTRVAMSELTIGYQSAPQPLRGDTFRPLGDALAGFLGVVVIGFAAIITIIAGLLPFAIVLIPIVWALLRWRRARGGRFFGGKRENVDLARAASDS